MALSCKADTKIIKPEAQLDLLRMLMREKTKMKKAMRMSFLFNFTIQGLGRKSHAPAFQLCHMRLVEGPNGVRDDCRVLGVSSWATKKFSVAEQEQGLSRDKVRLRLASCTASGSSVILRQTCVCV